VHSYSLQAKRAFAARAATATEVETAEVTAKAPEWKAFVDFKYVRDNAEAVQKNADARAAKCNVSKVHTLG